MPIRILELLFSFSDAVWTYLLTALLAGLGLWFTVRTGFVQLRMLPEMFRVLGEGIGKKTPGMGITPFQAFCVSTASRVGVGNIAGVAIAIALGGPGVLCACGLCEAAPFRRQGSRIRPVEGARRHARHSRVEGMI